MTLTINTNLSSLMVQLSLQKSTIALNKAMEQMTTGYRINSAKDDAAGYAVVTKMDTQIGGYSVARNNVNDGLDMIQTASSTLSIMSDSLSRLRALSVQALNGTYGSDSISAITREANSIISELYRIKSTAEYNGKKLFTSTSDVTNPAKELKLNSQGLLNEVVVRDTSGMTTLASVDENTTITSGTYSISSADELAKLARMVNSGKVKECEFVLANDIDLSGYSSGSGWIPIGNVNNKFIGSFDGNGYTISNLYINNSSLSDAALFGYTERRKDGSYTVIKNIILDNVNITSTNYSTASVVGRGSATSITNCSILDANIQGNNNTGGVMGYGYYVNTSYCYVNANILAKNSVGGISGGNNYSSSSYCYVKGKVQGDNTVGGVVAWGGAGNCYSEATVIGINDVGGIIGFVNGNIPGNYFRGSVSGDTNVGGIVGKAYMFDFSISNSIMEGKVSGKSNTGGFVGVVNDNKTITIKNSYYDGTLILGLPMVGSGSNNIDNVTDMTMGTSFYLQIGINSDSSSGLTYNTYISLPALNDLTGDGITSPDFLDKIDNCLNQLNTKQVELGAMENRLFSILDQIDVSSQSLIASRSVIKDADISKVTSNFIRAQILQQASISLLVTANQSPSFALGLI